MEVEDGCEIRVEGGIGRLVEGVLVDSPEALVEALGDLGEGRLALVSSAAGDADFAATSLAAKVQGPLALRQLLARLHVADTLRSEERRVGKEWVSTCR